MRRALVTAVAVGLAGAVLAGCGSTSRPADSSKGGGKVVSGATFAYALTADPGNLDPQASVVNGNIQLAQFAYDPLVHLGNDGKISSGLAAKWQVAGATATFTLTRGVTCADGTPLTAADVAANLTYVANPKNKSPLAGTYIPAGATAKATGTGTVTLTTPQQAPFLLEGLANLPIVCAAGMKNRGLLARKTSGTGPFQLTSASGDQYTYAVRKGYRWGPAGATTATAGIPAKIVAKVVANESTAANLLTSGGLNAAAIAGPDSQRLDRAGLFSTKTSSVAGEMWFNQGGSRPGADPAVRKALTQAVDLAELAKVVTSGRGTPGTVFAANPPVACRGNSVAAALPKHDLAAAKRALDAAGWRAGAGGVRSKGGKKLQLTFLINAALGSAGSSAAELAQQTWKQLGAAITFKSQDSAALSQTIFGSGDWDVAWLAVNVSSPDQLVPFLSGAVPPDGTNFAHIQNKAYQAGVAQASKQQGQRGCAAWLAAEANLVRNADAVPFADQVLKTYGSKATFETPGVLVPTSIRMRAS
ncbi:peptide/nickel transport system substrate-binding protein [Jatrophihabitans endophyticus]|uniref:Peptide/nickel transport system substrate-binding protein n=1 Tax=Jatrophihabitans endophyticus TaxID=1206085 RepID=A0A1M5DSY8_9ACTN|nr:ABC transporter substrate-binding protein [Jatrophihabitans endophyticus]SHF70089.1 peptide/nickel transport system substrate-binding protein [Jatrophihabitans endophyticus]